MTDKNPYREYHWSKETKQDIIKAFTLTIAKMDLKIVNVIIDKKKFKDNNYHVLENALKYNIQRIENDSDGQWNYLVITDEGRIAPMRKTARAIRAFNPIQSKYLPGFVNHPISNMIEDIMEKIHQNPILFKYVISFHFCTFIFQNRNSERRVTQTSGNCN